MMIIFDVSSKSSLENIKVWEKISNTINESFAFLIGNKIDQNERGVTDVETR
jgi:hypothetical protein